MHSLLIIGDNNKSDSNGESVTISLRAKKTSKKGETQKRTDREREGEGVNEMVGERVGG